MPQAAENFPKQIQFRWNGVDLGGPDAVGPLTIAAEKDASSRVKYVAGESLRKLGFSKGTGTR